jgi:hypothetical protein
MQAVLRFSRDGKAIRPDGPAHLYLRDGRNAANPIHSLRELEVCVQTTWHLHNSPSDKPCNNDEAQQTDEKR